MAEYKPLFRMGEVVSTPGALEAFKEAEQSPIDFLVRHAVGDWGELNEEDKAANQAALEVGDRLLSAYLLDTGVKIYIITEWDRSYTTMLLPEEY